MYRYYADFPVFSLIFCIIKSVTSSSSGFPLGEKCSVILIRFLPMMKYCSPVSLVTVWPSVPSSVTFDHPLYSVLKKDAASAAIQMGSAVGGVAADFIFFAPLFRSAIFRACPTHPQNTVSLRQSSATSLSSHNHCCNLPLTPSLAVPCIAALTVLSPVSSNINGRSVLFSFLLNPS